MEKKLRRNVRRYSPRVALAALGLKIRSQGLLDPVKQKVVILQKSIRNTPTQKLTDAFIAILAGARGLAEINTRVRADESLQRAFVRTSCADQSVVQETLNACTALNIRRGGYPNKEVQAMQIKLRQGQYYGAIGVSRSIPGFRLMEVQYPPGTKVPKHSHESACFGVMLHGAMTESYASGTLEAHVRNVGFNAPDEVHSNTISAAGASFLILEVEPDVTERALKHSPCIGQSAVFNGGEINWLATKLIQEWAQFDNVSPLAIEGLGLELMAARCRTSTERNLQRPEWLQRARDLIHAHFTEAITLSDIAAGAGVHRIRLARSFRQHYKSSIADYVRNLRIEFVQNHLCSTDLPLAEIAARAGFYDQAHMTRLFKRATGLTPARYRALWRPPLKLQGIRLGPPSVGLRRESQRQRHVC